MVARGGGGLTQNFENCFQGVDIILFSISVKFELLLRSLLSINSTEGGGG